MEEYYKTEASVDQYIKMAKGHSGTALIARLKPLLTSQSSLLELGSGPGTDYKILSEDFRVTGSDFSIEFLSRLKREYPEGEFLELDASSLDTDKKFDAIYSNKVLHHLSDEMLEASVHKQSQMLNSDGIICHSFWRGEGSEVFNGLFVNYHTDKELRQLFQNQFKILVLDGYPEFEEDDSVLLIARKK